MLYYRAAFLHGYRRRFFITSQGYLGSGPADMQMGDLICILLGSKFPVCLRKRDSDGGYHFVGAAYVHEIMHGEALAALALVSLKDQIERSDMPHLPLQDFQIF